MFFPKFYCSFDSSGLPTASKSNLPQINTIKRSLADEASNELLALPGVGVENLAASFISQTMRIADELQGGFGESSKFPQNPQIHALMRLVKQGQNVHPGLVEFIHLSLRAMASLNLMDHVNGGFFRYTTDPDWQTPHYEKMLYDNAQMVLLYLEAEKIWPGKGYALVAEQTLAFLEKHMKHAQGGYVSSLSAVDVNDIEGGGYLWQRQHLSTVLDKEDFDYLDRLWPLEDSGELLLPPMVGIGAEGDSKRNQNIREKLQQVARPEMPVDDKRLASWNALMLQALIAAADYDDKYRKAARTQFEFMRKAFISGLHLIRFADNAELAETTFEDYAFVAQAFNLFAISANDKSAAVLATRLVQDAFEYFFVDQRWKSNRQSLMPAGSGQWLIQDAVIPSALAQWLEAAANASRHQARNSTPGRSNYSTTDAKYARYALLLRLANCPATSTGTNLALRFRPQHKMLHCAFLNTCSSKAYDPLSNYQSQSSDALFRRKNF